jgi:hypothetical protein
LTEFLCFIYINTLVKAFLQLLLKFGRSDFDFGSFRQLLAETSLILAGSAKVWQKLLWFWQKLPKFGGSCFTFGRLHQLLAEANLVLAEAANLWWLLPNFGRACQKLVESALALAEPAKLKSG